MDKIIFISIQPSELATLIQSSVRKALKENPQLINQHAADHWFDLPKLRNYIPGNPAKVTIYKKVANRSIPYHKRGKKLYFLKSEIDKWLKEGRQKTISDIKNDADNVSINPSNKSKESENLYLNKSPP